MTETDATKITKFCSECGSEIDANAEICPKCGVRQVISKEKRKLRIKEKLPLINSDNKRIRIAGYVIYAFVFLAILGALVPSGPVPMKTYTFNGEYQIDAPEGLVRSTPISEIYDTYIGTGPDGHTLPVLIIFMNQELYNDRISNGKKESPPSIEMEPITSVDGHQFIVYESPGQNKENDVRDAGYDGFCKIGDDRYISVAEIDDDYNRFATIIKSFKKI